MQLWVELGEVEAVRRRGRKELQRAADSVEKQRSAADYCKRCDHPMKLSRRREVNGTLSRVSGFIAEKLPHQWASLVLGSEGQRDGH